jgi:hypothetical protein
MTDPDPRHDLAAFITHEQGSGNAEVDPYSYAMTVIRTALEFALDDGISDSMNNVEFENLEAIAYAMPPEDRPDPRVG